jgi:hypothetical protein
MVRRWTGRLVVTILCPRGFREQRRRKIIEMAQDEEFGSFNLSDEGFVQASELLWPK